MCAAKKRIEFFVDIFDLPAQRAHALTDLMPIELVGAILQEFREVECLDIDPTKYQLVKLEDQAPLNDAETIEIQLKEGDHLRLQETHSLIPAGARQVDADLYLRDVVTGRVFKLQWLPAIIGRDDPHQSNNQLVAANLASFKTGLRVSRRHARILQENGCYFVEPMSANPTSIRTVENKVLRLAAGRHQLMPGDTVVLERSEIALKFIVRDAQVDSLMASSQPQTEA